MVLLLRMLVGSRLYGVETPTSDYDIKEIYDHIKPNRVINEYNEEIVQWPLSMLMKVANYGGHNGLEIMFAPRDWPEVDLLADLRASYKTNYYLCYPRFVSAHKTLLARGDQKGRDRSHMLDSWLTQIGETGRFNPRWIEYRHEEEI